MNISRDDLITEAADVLWRSLQALGSPWPTDQLDLRDWIAFAAEGYDLSTAEAVQSETLTHLSPERALNARRRHLHRIMLAEPTISNWLRGGITTARWRARSGQGAPEMTAKCDGMSRTGKAAWEEYNQERTRNIEVKILVAAAPIKPQAIPEGRVSY